MKIKINKKAIKGKSKQSVKAVKKKVKAVKRNDGGIKVSAERHIAVKGKLTIPKMTEAEQLSWYKAVKTAFCNCKISGVVIEDFIDGSPSVEELKKNRKEMLTACVQHVAEIIKKAYIANYVISKRIEELEDPSAV